MLQQLASELGITEIPESWKRNYEYAVTCLPDEIEFLQKHYLDHVRKRVHLSEAKANLISEAMEAIRRDDNLRMLAWLWHCILYRRPDPHAERVGGWPAPTGPSDEQKKLESVFPAVVLLSGYDRLVSLHRERNIPEDVILETLNSVEVNMQIYEERRGRPGLGMGYFNWLQHCFHARLYKIGRMEYEMRTFSDQLQVYRHVSDGTIVALSEAGVKYRSDGLVDGTNGIVDEVTGWTATLTETKDEITGYPIHPGGYALKEPMTLKKQEWQLVLSSGDPVISVHIPRKGSFTYEVCRDSFIQATEFFAAYYADRPYAAMICLSWLLDPQLLGLLDETSNLAQFQKWYHLYPIQSDDGGIYSFVFMRDRCEVDQLQEDTSLQRKLKQFMKAGGQMHSAGGFILPEMLAELVGMR